ncbi:MAG: PIN domain-containing protein [Verrucomicrobiota bacterium]|nr:PIN domain-containing protein [Verrucomicrobiota bacterium]
MARAVLIDSGPLVAVLRRRDQHHAWARAHFEAATQPFLTCEAVISECFFLLEGAASGKENFSAILERGLVLVEFSFATQRAETLRLIRRYSTTPMSLANACLVRMAEQIDSAAVFTTDRDFRIYRKSGRQVIPLVMPE